ncbi:MAG TPA: LysM peptidoglycan-binding domain-containing protein [Candidatus Sulfomarinibacteraceae bacterium]|nr:LysM peptidoglycan-binding domain-containing protein [Candidatus Sulfomarinibacteraceae bacterium]
MRLEEEHRRLHSRGEMVKFAILVIIFLLTVLTVSALRPLIFEQVVPAVFGWNESVDAAGEPAADPATATPRPTVQATPTETVEEEATPDESTPPAPDPTPITYEVQPGDTLVRISERFGVSIQAIVQANGIANPDRIQPGDVIVIPVE